MVAYNPDVEEIIYQRPESLISTVSYCPGCTHGIAHRLVAEVLDEMGYVYRRPTQDLSHAQDQAAHDQAEALIEALKKGPNKVILSSSLWTKRP